MSDSADQTGLENMLGGTGEPEKETQLVTDNGDANPAAWTSQLSKELRESEESFSKLKGFKTIGELAKAYLSAAKSSVDASNFKDVMERLGAPKDGEGYDFESGLEKELSDFGKFAKEAMLTGKQAEAMLGGFRKIIAGRNAGYINEAVEAAPKIAAGLISEFGPDAAKYYQKACGHENLNKRIAAAGLGADKDLARALVMLGREMTEDSTPGGGGGARSYKKPESVKDGLNLSY
jgi:hypothetical protein